MLEARETVKDRRVLDLFAGTGALAIEALSRGAASAVCVEQGPRECRAIRQNAVRAGVADRLRVLAMPVARAIPTLAQHQFDLVFMDPPYEDREAVPATIAMLLASDPLLSEGAMLVAEQSARTPAPPAETGLRRLADRRYGDTLISLLTRQAETDPEGLPL